MKYKHLTRRNNTELLQSHYAETVLKCSYLFEPGRFSTRDKLRSTSWLRADHCRSFWEPRAACKWTWAEFVCHKHHPRLSEPGNPTSFERAKEVRRTLMTNVINKMLLMKDLSLKWWKCSESFEIQGCFPGWSIKKASRLEIWGISMVSDDRHSTKLEKSFFFKLLAVVLNQIIWLCEHWN